LKQQFHGFFGYGFGLINLKVSRFFLSANPEVYGNVLHDEVLQDVTCFPHHRSTFFMFFYCGRDGCDVFDRGCDCSSGIIWRDGMEHTSKKAGTVKVDYTAMSQETLAPWKSKPVA